MKILYVNPVGSGTLDAWFEEQLAGCAGPDVAVETCHLELDGDAKSPFLPQQPFFHGVLHERLARAQDDGYDAAVIGCSGDPGLVEARRMLEMPVTAPLEAALHLASVLHQRVAILVADGFEAHVLYQDLARIYGLSHVISEILTVPMRYPDAERLERLMRDDPDTACGLVLERHRAVLEDEALELARGALQRGAGAIYAGCTFWTGSRLQPFREALGAPVVDPGQAAVLLAAAAARARQGVRPAVSAGSSPR
jgi:allantoin racemase